MSHLRLNGVRHEADLDDVVVRRVTVTYVVGVVIVGVDALQESRGQGEGC